MMVVYEPNLHRSTYKYFDNQGNKSLKCETYDFEQCIHEPKPLVIL